MDNNFTEEMSRWTEEELVKILTVQRANIHFDIILAAERELEKRQISTEKIEKIINDLKAKEEKQNAIDKLTVSSWIRWLHAFIDMIVLIIIFLILVSILGIFISSNDTIIVVLINVIPLLISFFLYYIVMEFRYQKTIGKLLTGTKVILKNGQKPQLKSIFIRTLCRLIPFDQFSFLFSKNGFYDYFSNTTVINDE